MPLYVYECTSCGRKTEDMRKVEERHDPAECYFCGNAAQLAVQPVAFDYAKMGTDPGFPTANDRWAKSHTRDARKG